MTATAAATDEPQQDDIPRYESRAGRKRPDEDVYPFYLDDDRFEMIRPKVSAALNLIELSERTDDGRNLTDIGADLQSMMFTLIRWVRFEETAEGEPLRGRALLLDRLNTFEDPLDLPDLVPIFIDLGKKMFGRPTGPSRGSSDKRGGRASNGSAAGTRSTPRRTSSTSPGRSS